MAFDESRRAVGGFPMQIINAGEKLGGAHDICAASPSEASNVGLIQQNKSPRMFSRISGLQGTSQTTDFFSSDTQHQAVHGHFYLMPTLWRTSVCVYFFLNFSSAIA